MGIRAVKMRRAVFLDRDGVLNRAIIRGGDLFPPQTVAELEILPGVLEACNILREAGFLLIVVTNQPDVSRGSTTKEMVEEINNVVRSRLPLDDIRVCYHDDRDQCACRKPAPGLLLEAAKEWGIDLKESFMVGDRWKDVEAGKGAGCRTVLTEAPGTSGRRSSPDHSSESLHSAADWIVRQVPQGTREDR